MRRGESEDKLPCSFNFGTSERNQRQAPGVLLPKEDLSVTYWSICLMGPRRGGAEKCLRTCQESLPSANLFID